MTTESPESSTEDEIPLPSQQPLEVDFIDHRVTEYRDVNGRLLAKYDVNKQRFVERTRRVTFQSEYTAMSLDPTSEDMQASELALGATTDSFKRAIGELQKKKGKKDEIATFSLLSECHDWREVSKVLQNAVKAYEDSDSVSGKIRKAFRRVGDNSKSIQSFVALLPDGNYKTLCGGLTLILTAMGKHAEVRETIAQLLGELPDFVKDCEDYIALYQGKNILQVRVNELYVELLSALGEIVKWYTQSSLKRIKGSLLQNSSYGEAIHRRVQNIQKCRARFQVQLDKFQHCRLQLMDETGLETNAMAHRIDQGVHGLQESLAMYSVEAKRRDSVVCRKMSDATSALNGIKDLLADKLKNAKWHSGIDRVVQGLLDDSEKHKQELEEREEIIRRKESEIAKFRAQANTTAELVNQLSQTPQSLERRLSLCPYKSTVDSDVVLVQSTGLNASISFQYRSRWVTETSEFHKWLGGSRSAVLVVQGNTELEPVSSLSFLVALLHEKLEGQDKVLTLPFFCGLQESSVIGKIGKVSQPVVLLRSLLAQLLGQRDIDWEHGDSGRPCLSFLGQKAVSELEAGSYPSYLSTIISLISVLLPMYDCIFMMVDGLDYLEEGARDETRQLIKSLIKLVKAANTRKGGEMTGTVKVLCTASTHLEYHPLSGKGAVVLDMPEDVDGDEDGFEELSGEE